jgi:hypothetical protein
VILAIDIAFTLLNSGVSVVFSYLSRDFWSAREPVCYYLKLYEGGQVASAAASKPVASFVILVRQCY